VAHATWNAIAHAIDDRMVALVLLGLGSVAFALPFALLARRPAAEVWPLLVFSTVLHVGYTLLLMLSYRLGEFSQVYPLARGTAPLVVVLVAVLVVGELPAAAEVAGIVLIAAALVGLALTGRRAGANDPRAVAAAIATGLMIAAYTVVDGIAVRRSGSAAGYAGWLVAIEGAGLVVAAVAIRGRALIPGIRRVWLPGVAGGGLSVLAYGLVLWAQTRGPLAVVSALRETSIIAGALIGTLVFHERFGRARTIAAAVVVAGIALITLG